MNANGRNNAIMMFVAVAAVVLFVCSMNSNSTYSIHQREYAPFNGQPARGPSMMGPSMGNGMNRGTGLASSLLPREVASAEDFGQFAPEDILKGQNFLEPRNQIGFPETIGGNLRNANQQIRADPPNPKEPFVWNNSTIVPDLMQRSLCA